MASICSSNYDLEFPPLPSNPKKKMDSPLFPVFIKLMSGELISLEINKSYTTLQLYRAVQTLFPEYKLFEFVLSRLSSIHMDEDDEKHYIKLDLDTDVCLYPKPNEIFFLIIDIWSYYIYLTLGLCASDRVGNNYIISTLRAYSKALEKSFDEQYLIRIPNNDHELIFPVIYHMDDIEIICIHRRIDLDQEDYSYIAPPNIDHSYDSIYSIIPRSILDDPYFSVHSTIRKQFLYKILEKEWNQLMKYCIHFETDLY